MQRIRKVNKDGKDITIFDFSGMEDTEAIVDLAKKCTEKCLKDEPNSRLSVTYIKDLHFNQTVGDAMKKFASDAEPTSKMAVVAGAEGLQKVMLKAVEKFSGRNFKVYDTLDQAIEYLEKV